MRKRNPKRRAGKETFGGSVIDSLGEFVRLSDRDRDAFMKIMESDPTPNAKLLAAIKRHRKHVAEVTRSP